MLRLKKENRATDAQIDNTKASIAQMQAQTAKTKAETVRIMRTQGLDKLKEKGSNWVNKILSPFLDKAGSSAKKSMNVNGLLKSNSKNESSFKKSFKKKYKQHRENYLDRAKQGYY